MTLCEDVFQVYFNLSVTDTYCNSSKVVKSLNHMEITMVTFSDLTDTTVQLDSIPTALNTLLTTHHFFNLWPDGSVTIVSNQTRLYVLVSAVLGSFLGLTLVLLLVLLKVTNALCCLSSRSSILVGEEVV